MFMVTKPSPAFGHHSPKHQPRDDELRRDRIAAMVVLVIAFVVMALVIWLASLGGGTGELDSFHYWSLPY